MATRTLTGTGKTRLEGSVPGLPNDLQALAKTSKPQQKQLQHATIHSSSSPIASKTTGTAPEPRQKAPVTVKPSVRDRIRRLKLASSLEMKVDMHCQILKPWMDGLNDWKRFMMEEAKSENLLKDFPAVQFRVVGIERPQSTGLNLGAQPYLCVTGLVDEANVQQMHAILSMKRYRKRYKMFFRGVCYTLDPRYSIELAATDAAIALDSSPSLTLCGAYVNAPLGGSTKSFTIGGIVEVGNLCYALTAGHIASRPVVEKSLSNDHPNIGGAVVGKGLNDEDWGDEDMENEKNEDLDDIAGSGIIVDHWSLPVDVPVQVVNKILLTRKNECQDDPSLSRALGGVVATGAEWSLITIKDDALRLPNLYEDPASSLDVGTYHSSSKTQDPGKHSARKYLSGVGRAPSHRIVHILAGRSGRCKGLLSCNESFVHLPSGEFITTWMIHFDAAFGKSSHHAPLLLSTNDIKTYKKETRDPG